MARNDRSHLFRLCALVVAATILVVSCGDGADDGVAMGTEGSPPSSTTSTSDDLNEGDTSELCAQWAAVYDGQDEGLNQDFFAELERVAPDSLGDAVTTLIEIDRLERVARSEDRELPDADEDDLSSITRVMGWVETRCAGGVRVAPPLDAVPAGFEVCAANAYPIGLADEVDPGRVVVYAPGDADDPYAGLVLALTWGAEGHAGDGDATPVTLRADRGVTDAVVAPITAFQQVVLPDLGSVVAWSEDGHGFGLYGRGWTLDRADELLAIAEGIEPVDTGGEASYEIRPDALPAGFTTVVTAPASSRYVMQMGLGAYSVSYHSPVPGSSDGTGEVESEEGVVVNLNGSPSEPGAEEVWRAFVLDSERIEVGGRVIAISDDAWGEDGPVVASWKAGDGHVNVMGIGVDREVVLDLIESSRELTDEEWMELSASMRFC